VGYLDMVGKIHTSQAGNAEIEAARRTALQSGRRSRYAWI
jgi:hypothetical protein